jgi:hypothetical protein
VITLRELANWEDRLLHTVERAGGDVEERDRLLESRGVYADYAAIFQTYVDYVDRVVDPSEVAESLKRAVFISWYAAAAPSVLSGIGELPELGVRTIGERVDALCRGGALDPELAVMLPHYYAGADFALTRLADLRDLVRHASSTDPVAWRAEGWTAERFVDRGQMGRYWRKLVAGR